MFGQPAPHDAAGSTQPIQTTQQNQKRGRMSRIHPTAIVEPGTQLDESVEVGPYAVIGAHVVVAARIEPDVAPGSACVSEALAGALATLHGDRVRCGYVGRTQGRKGFPATPIFNLTRA